jgi:hypothetical protein
VRRRRSLAFAGLFVLALVAIFGFASFATDGPDRAEYATTQASLPDLVSGRLTAAVLSSRLSSSATGQERTPSMTIETGPTPSFDDGPVATATAPDVAVTTTQAQPTTTGGPEATTTTRVPATLPPVTQPPTSFPADVERWRPLVATYFPERLIDEALSVMQCESQGKPNAENPYSTAAGLYQFIASTWTWASTNADFAGVSVFDPEANIATAAFLVDHSIDRGLPPWQHWVCQPDVGS